MAVDPLDDVDQMLPASVPINSSMEHMGLECKRGCYYRKSATSMKGLGERATGPAELQQIPQDPDLNSEHVLP